MYTKNLIKDFRLRISEEDFQFLVGEADRRCATVSETVRGIIGEYRRSLELLDSLKSLANQSKGGRLSDGDTTPDIDHFV